VGAENTGQGLTLGYGYTGIYPLKTETMRLLLISILLIFFSSLRSQDIRLENLWAKGSDTIYSGVNNYFRIDGNTDAIKKIDANAGVQRQHDTLLVLPSQGKVNITIYTGSGKSTYTYNAVELPLPSVHFICFDQKKIAPTVKIKADETSKLFSHYTIVQYTIVINGKERTGQFDYITSEVLSAIDHLTSGQYFQVKRILLYNKETDNYIDADPQQSFELSYNKKGNGNFTNTCIADYIVPVTTDHK
jgi:hypothetical protein